MASDREEKHRKHTSPDGCGNVVLIEGEDEEDEDEEKTYSSSVFQGTILTTNLGMVVTTPRLTSMLIPLLLLS